MKSMAKHENYKELIWVLAKTDLKLRYHGSVLGYLWAILKPLMMFAVLNFVFSSLFNPGGANGRVYSLQLFISLVMFNFFSEGTMAGMLSLMAKAQLVTKIYVPRWTIILASTVNSAMVFLLNLIIVVFFFAIKGFLPSAEAILTFFLFSIATYVVILSFSFLTAPLYVKFRDLSMIWEVLLTVLFYATPVFYSLEMLPPNVQKLLLLNPIAFIINFNKKSLISNQFALPWQYATFSVIVIIGFAVSLLAYRKFISEVAEKI
jgi:ABC-2 type transport system permease protein